MKWEEGNERYVGKDLEEGGRSLIQAISPVFDWRNWGKTRKPSVRIPGNPADIQQLYLSDMKEYSDVQWACWCSGKALDLHSDGTQFKQRQCHRLSWGFSSFPSTYLFRQMPGYVVQLGHDQLLPYPYTITIHDLLISSHAI
jgi:hypothetical protein